MNYLKTSILLASLTALLVVVGYFVGGTNGALLFFGFSLIMNLVSFWFSDRIALSMSGAQPIDRQQAPGLYSDTEAIASKMGIPTPKLYIINQPQPNAFATGRNPSNSAVAVTQGLIQALNREEVRAVIAHELGHIKNRDVLISTIAAVIAGTISSLANMALWFGGGSDDDNGNPLAALLLIILAPLAATIIQLAVSRTREFQADATAAKYTGQPRNLASALLKIEDYVRQVPMQVNPALSTLYIQNPISGRGMANLFSTHPSTADRVARLEQMSNIRS